VAADAEADVGAAGVEAVELAGVDGEPDEDESDPAVGVAADSFADGVVAGEDPLTAEVLFLESVA